MAIKRTTPFVDKSNRAPDLTWSQRERIFYFGREAEQVRHARRGPPADPPTDPEEHLNAATRAVATVQELYGDACQVRITVSES